MADRVPSLRLEKTRSTTRSYVCTNGEWGARLVMSYGNDMVVASKLSTSELVGHRRLFRSLSHAPSVSVSKYSNQ